MLRGLVLSVYLEHCLLELRADPLPDSIKRVEKAPMECKSILPKVTQFRKTKQSLPRMRAQTKIHKQGEEITAGLRHIAA